MEKDPGYPKVKLLEQTELDQHSTPQLQLLQEKPPADMHKTKQISKSQRLQNAGRGK